MDYLQITISKIRFMIVALLSLLIGFLCYNPNPLFAQQQDTTVTYTSDNSSATLMGWHQRMDITLKDRFHSREGFVTDRGAFQQYVPGMDEEYHMDVFTFGFTPQEDYIWSRSQNGFRTYLGSVNVVNFATTSELKSSIALSGKHRIDLRAIQEDNLQASRIFVDLGYRFNFMSNHWVGFSHTAGSFKPDLDGTMFYQWGSIREGMLRLDISFLDYANNFIFDGLGVDSKVSDISRVYESTPKLFTLKFISPDWIDNLRAEVVAGFQTEADAGIGELTFNERNQVTVTNIFSDKEKNSYQGVLLEYDMDYLTVGATFQRTNSETERDTVEISPVNVDYQSEQTMRKFGLYVLANSERLSWQTWVNFQRYEDIQEGSQFEIATIRDSLDFREKRIMMRNRVQWRPPHRGLIAGIEHIMDFREFLDDDPELDEPLDFEKMNAFLSSDDSGLSAIHDLNSRLTFIIGYQFHPRAKVEIGVGYDLDNDLNSKAQQGGQRFDDGFGRIQLRW